MKKQLVNNEKLWRIETKGTSHLVEYGKVDGKLRTNEKTFDTEEACKKDAKKLIDSKIKGGYIELTIDIKGADLDLLYRIEQVQRGNATTIDNGYVDVRVEQKEVLDEICKCTALEELNIITEFDLPEALGNLVNLKSLTFKVNSKNSIPKSIKNLQKLEELKVSIHYGLAYTFPEEIGELSSLKKLKLEGNDESFLPDAICKLSNLESLEINYFENKTLPKDLGNLSKLKKLELFSFRNLVELPISIGSLTNLEELIVKRCRNYYYDAELEGITIPKEIGKLKSLMLLELEENGLKALPEEIGNLQNLKQLLVENNYFDHFPIGINKLIHLKTLELYSSEVAIKKIPEEFVNLAALENFTIHLSEDSNIPSQFVVEGIRFNSIVPESIIDYLKNHTNQQKTNSNKVAKVTSNKEQLVKNRADLIEKVFSKIEDELYEDDQEKVMELRNFITGETNDLPLALRDDVYDFESIITLLNPLGEWNFIDERVLQFMAQEAFYFQKKNRFTDDLSFSGYHDELIENWFIPQLEKEEKEQNLMDNFIALLVQAGVKESICFEAFLAAVPSKLSFIFPDKTPNSVGRYILKYAKNDIESLTDLIVIHQTRNAFIELMLANSREQLETILPKLLYISEYEGSGGANKHIPFYSLEILVAHDFNAYEHYIHELVSQTDCHECSMECYRILLEYNEKEYREATLLKIKETLAIITAKKNEKRNATFSWSLQGGYDDQTPGFIDWALEKYGIALKEAVAEYVKNTKSHNLGTTQTIINHLGIEAVSIIEHDFKVITTGEGSVEYYRDLLRIISPFSISFAAKLWTLAEDKKTEIAEIAAFELARTKNASIKSTALEYLNAKKDKQRLAATRVFYFWKDEESSQTLRSILKTERNDGIRNIAVDAVYSTQDLNKITIASMKERIQEANTLEKLTTKITHWQDQLPVLVWADGVTFTPEEMNYIFYRQSLYNTITPDLEALPIYHLIEKESAKIVVKAYWELLLENEGLSIKPKGLLAPIGLLGDDDVIDSLTHEAIKNTKIEAVEILALIGTEKAAWALDKIIKVNEPKENRLLYEATAAFATIADTLQVTALELQERMLPTFGFTARELKFTENDTPYSLFIDSSFVFSYKNENEKVVKSITKASDDFKTKERENKVLLKTVVKQFSQSLNSHLVTQKKWDQNDWQAFFLHHPVAFAFAQNSIWTTGEKYFIVDANGQIVDTKGQPIMIEKEQAIHLAHPIHLGQKATKEWFAYLKTKNLASPFNQLNREIHTIPEEDNEKTLDKQFDLKRIQVSTFRYRTSKVGWKNAFISSRMVTSYKKTYEADNIEVFIETKELPIREGYQDTMYIGSFYFVPIGSVRTDSYLDENPSNENDHRLIPFKEIPPIVYSETIADLRKISD